MRYLFQRVAHNTSGWMRPSKGRLNSKIDGGYLKDTGFGHEDWNLKKDVSLDGFVRGYTFYAPKDSVGSFAIMFATYDTIKGWVLVGYYARATVDGSPARFPKAILSRRAAELMSLENADSLGGVYVGLSLSKKAKELDREAPIYRWRVLAADVHAISVPLKLPKRLTKSFGRYFTTATEISAEKFEKILKFSKYPGAVPMDDYPDGGDVEFPEGRKYQITHFKRERSRKLVKIVRSRFKEKHGRLFCQVCEFDFEKVYGAVGVDFIEVHHLKPVSELKPKERTRPSDMAVVCSNCHRMLHRKRPWPKISELRRDMEI